MNECLNGQLDEWMNECMDEWVDEWMSGGMNEWMSGGMNEWMHEWMNEWIWNKQYLSIEATPSPPWSLLVAISLIPLNNKT